MIRCPLKGTHGYPSCDALHGFFAGDKYSRGVSPGNQRRSVSPDNANVTYTARAIDGSTIAVGHGTVATGAHFAKFINQLTDVAPDFSLPLDLLSAIRYGSLDIACSAPLSVLALRMTLNQRGETLLSTTPVADLMQPPGSDPLYFPQIADGGGYTTSSCCKSKLPVLTSTAQSPRLP